MQLCVKLASTGVTASAHAQPIRFTSQVVRQATALRGPAGADTTPPRPHPHARAEAKEGTALVRSGENSRKSRAGFRRAALAMATFPSLPFPRSLRLSPRWCSRKYSWKRLSLSRSPNPKSQIKKKGGGFSIPRPVHDRSPSFCSAPPPRLGRVASRPLPTNSELLPPLSQIEQAAGSPAARFLGSQIQSLSESRRRRRYHGKSPLFQRRPTPIPAN